MIFSLDTKSKKCYITIFRTTKKSLTN